MNVLLPPELEQFVNERVRTGANATASDVVLEGVRLLKEREEAYQKRLEEIRSDIELSIAEAERGELAPLNARATLEQIRQQNKSRKAEAG